VLAPDGKVFRTRNNQWAGRRGWYSGDVTADTDEVLFERRRAPLNALRVTFAVGLATLAGVGAAMALSDVPTIATVAAMGGVATMIFGLLAVDGSAFGTRLGRLHGRLRWVTPPAGSGYRERPPEPELWVDDDPIRQPRLRELVVGHFASQDFDFYPLFLVLEDQVVELDVFRDRAQALAAQERLAERLELQTREMHTGIFGTGATSGCLFAAVTLLASVTAIGAGGVGTVFVEGPLLQVLLPTLMVFALWGISGVARRVGARRVRPDVDREVIEAFDLGRPRVRVAADEEATAGVEATDELAAALGEDERTR